MPNVSGLLKAGTLAVGFWDRFSGEGRTARAMEAVWRADLDELYIELHTLKRKVKGLEEEAQREPELCVRAIGELQEAIFGAGPTKRRALRRLTYRRFDPRFPRDTREVWFDRAKDLKDHEIHGLLILRGNGPVTYFSGFAPERRYPQHGPAEIDEIGWSQPEAEENHTILSFLASNHPDLVAMESKQFAPDDGECSYDSFRLTEHGKRLVEAMLLYENDLTAEPDDQCKADPPDSTVST